MVWAFDAGEEREEDVDYCVLEKLQSFRGGLRDVEVVDEEGVYA